jgi:hypothetical protein
MGLIVHRFNIFPQSDIFPLDICPTDKQIQLSKSRQEIKKVFSEVLEIKHTMEQCALKNVNNYLNTNIYSYLETSGIQSSNLYLNVVHFFNTSVN